MATSNINKKFNDLLHKELDMFFDTLFEKAETDDFEFTKENLIQLAKEFFHVEKAKKIKEKKERKIPDEAERCVIEKKDNTRCNGSKNKKEEYFDTEYANMCPLHINAAKKAKEEVIVPNEIVVDEIEKPIEQKVKPKKKNVTKKEVIAEDEL
jgi:hypothetical protein